MPPPSFAGPTGGRVCPARYVNCLACRGGYHPPASVGATCGRPSAGGAPRGARPMGPPRRPNGVVVVGRGGPAEGMSFRACPEANDPQLGPTTAPPFLPKEMGGKKGQGLRPLDPPKRGLMAAVGCTDRAKTNRALPPASSAQVPDHSLHRKRQSSFPPLCLLSPPNPLRWASAGAP